MQLAEFYSTSKTELFNFWLDSGRDWSKCVLKVQRAVQARNRATKGWEAIQGKEIRKKMSEEKFLKVVEARKAAGLFYEDEDFPGDVEDSRFKSCKTIFFEF